MKRSLVSKLVIGLILVGIAGMAYYFYSKSDGPKENIGVVTRGDIIQRVTVAGAVNPNRKTLFSAPYNGYVGKIFVKMGQQVKEGDPIVTITQSLKSQGEQTFPLRASFAGTVVQILRSEGEFIDLSSPDGRVIVRVDDLTRLFVDASVPEMEIGKLKIGQEVNIKAGAILNDTYKGKIERISLAGKEQKDWDKSRVEFQVLIAFLDPDERVKAGMSVILDIITHKVEQVLTLRHEFVQKDGEQYFVITAKGERKNIEVGIQNEEIFEVKSGIGEGEKVKQADFLTLLNG